MPDCSINTLCSHGIECSKAEILELDSHIVHPQTVGDGGVDVQSFAGDAPSLIRRQHFEGAHVVEAVSDLDQNYAQIFGHCHGHFLKVLSLRFSAAAESDFIELTDTIYQIGHGIPELVLYRGLGDAGVFDHIMQHGSHQRLMVHVHLDQYAGDRQRMGHIRFAASAELPFMSLLGVVVRSSDAVDLVDLQIVRQIAGQRVDAFRNWGLYVSTPCGGRGARLRW